MYTGIPVQLTRHFRGLDPKIAVKDDKKESMTPSSSSTSKDEYVQVSNDNETVEAQASLFLQKLASMSMSSGTRARGKLFNKDGTLFNATGAPPRYKVPTNNTIVPIVQNSVVGAFITSNVALNEFAQTSFTVASLDQVSSLTAVFDQYRIIRVEVWLTPRNSVSQGNTANPGIFATVVDFDDATALATLASAYDYTNCVISNGLEGHYRTWKPHAAVAAYSGAFTSYANVPSPWIDAVSTGVQHYGLKVAWSPTDASGYIYDMAFRLHTEWRNIR